MAKHCYAECCYAECPGTLQYKYKYIIYIYVFSSEDFITLMIDILSNKKKYEDWDSFSEFILFSKWFVSYFSFLIFFYVPYWGGCYKTFLSVFYEFS